MDKPTFTMIHVGPVPINLVGEVMAQITSQGWERDAILFAGHVAANQSALTIPKGPVQSVPTYYLLFTRETIPGQEIQPPTLNIGGQTL